MGSDLLIGIDIGTSGAKAVVMDRAGRVLAWAGREYPIHTPQPGWAEQNPQEWLNAAIDCLRIATKESEIDPSRVAGIGLAAQMHSLVCLDEHMQPVRPAIIWADQRSGEQARALTEIIGRENLAEWTGNPLAAGFLLASWQWMKEHEPLLLAQTRWLVTPKTYLLHRLTGTLGADPSDASATLLFDPHRGQWSAPLLGQVGLDGSLLPEVYPSYAVAGGLLPEFAAACGLTAGTPVMYGSSDVSAQALGQGIVEPGTVSCTIGTGGQLFAPVSQPVHDPLLRLHLFCHALPELWHHEAAILTAGLCLRWLRDGMWPGQNYAALANSADGVEAAADGLYFLPFLAGERTPYMDANLRAGFLGLTLRHGQPHMVRAAMEGVVFALRQGLDLMQELGTPVDRLIATGGGTRHPLWLQLQADIFNRMIYIPHQGAESEIYSTSDTARGAALLAGIGTGVYADAKEAIREAVRAPVVGAEPDPARVAVYAKAYEGYVQWAEIITKQYKH